MQRLPRADLEHRGPPCHPAEVHRRTSRLPSVDLQQPALGRKPLGTPERMARGSDPLREDRPILPRRPLPRRYIRLAQELTGRSQVLPSALARAFRYQKLLDEGRYASISEMASAEKIERGYLGTLLRLTLLAPDILEAVLDGRLPRGLDLPQLLEPIAMQWAVQREALANAEYRHP